MPARAFVGGWYCSECDHMECGALTSKSAEDGAKKHNFWLHR